MAYPENIDKFTEKLNKLDSNTYVIEEEAEIVDGVYEGELEHDNVSLPSINVYTGSKLTGNKVENVIVSTPSLTPWKTHIKIFSDVSPVYITYQTTGDTVEAEDINKAQNSIVNTQKTLNSEIDRAKGAENVLTDNLNEEITRATDSEQVINNNLNSEISRAKSAENTLADNLNSEINRSKNREDVIEDNLNSEINRATQSESNINTALTGEINRTKNAEEDLTDNLNGEINRATGAEETLNNSLSSEVNRAKQAESSISNTVSTNKPNWDDKYTKNEIDNKISQVITDLDWKEAVSTFADIATTYQDPQDGWTVNVKDTDITYRYSGTGWVAISANSIPLATSSVDGKMSKGDKAKLDGIENNANNYVHPATHPASMITTDSTHEFVKDTDIVNWNDANSQKHTHNNLSTLQTITQALIDTWNAAYTHISDTVKHITSAERTLWNTVSNKVDGIAAGATNVEDSTTNGNIKINGTENIVYTHPGSGTNPHGTTKTDVGLVNVTNDSQVKRTEMGANSGVATLDTNGVNAQTPKSHTHDDRYYTESESDNKFATKTEIGNAGYGDMLKSIYDTDNDGIVDKAEKLATARTISLAGDATGSSSFDGSANFSVSLALAVSGVTAGTYRSVTVDSKGRVTAGTNPTTRDGYGLSDVYTKTEVDNKTSLNRIDITNQTININDYNLSSGTPHMQFYICKTMGGSANISNIPVTNTNFILNVELIRFNGSGDYITRQNFTDTVGQNTYIRFCISGTWSSWSRILTSTKKCTWNDLKGV